MKIFTENNKSVELSEDQWEGIQNILKEQILFRVGPDWEKDSDRRCTINELRLIRGKFRILGDGLFLDADRYSNMILALQWQLKIFDPEGDSRKISYVGNIISKLT